MIRKITSLQVRQEIAEHLERAKGIQSLAESEDRALTDDDKADLDQIIETVGNDGEDGKPASGLWAECYRLEKIEAQIRKMGDKPKDADPTPGIKDGNEGKGQPKIILPRELKHYNNLRGFSNDQQGREDAYRTGRWIAAVLFGHQESRRWCNDWGLAMPNPQDVMTTADANAAGVFVIPEFESAIINLKEERGVFSRYCRTLPMASSTLTVPRRSGGVTAYYVNETSNNTITASDAEWDSVTLTCRDLGVLVRMSRDLAADAFVDLAMLVTEEIAYAFANAEDTAGFLGDGTSTYGGIHGVMNPDTATNAGTIKTLTGGDTSYGAILLTDLEIVVGQLPQYAEMDAAWYIHKSGWANSLQRLQDAAGGTTGEMIGSGYQRTFLGYPVRFSQVMNSTLTAQTDTNLFCFGDLSQTAKMGMRSGIEIAVSTDRYFELNQLAIRGIQRFDIVVHERGTATAAGSMIIVRTPGS